MLKKDILLFGILHLILILYITLCGVYFEQNNYTMYITTSIIDVWIILLIMFLLELLSTMTFSLRIHYTAKQSYNKAGIIGTISWIIAGMQGILFINGDIDFHDPDYNFVYTYLAKLPIIAVATYTGIYYNLKYLTKLLR